MGLVWFWSNSLYTILCRLPLFSQRFAHNFNGYGQVKAYENILVLF
jgi:hypothetical protein